MNGTTTDGTDGQPKCIACDGAGKQVSALDGLVHVCPSCKGTGQYPPPQFAQPIWVVPQYVPLRYEGPRWVCPTPVWTCTTSNASGTSTTFQ